MLSNDRFLATRPSFGEFSETTPYAAIEQKEDGWRLTIIRRDGKTQAFSKKPRVDLWPKVQRNEQVRDAVLSLPDNTIVDGEAHVPGGRSSDVPTALTTGEGWKLSAFALPYLGGQDMRKTCIWNIRELLSVYGFHLTWSIPDPDFTRDQLLEMARGAKIEGFVLKLQHYLGWARIKPKKTVDAIVMGWIEGNGRHKGRLGALRVGLLTPTGKWVEIASVGGGYSDEQRDAIVPGSVLGKVCEVEYDSVTSGLRLRFPQFLRWRDDKEATACRFSQISF